MHAQLSWKDYYDNRLIFLQLLTRATPARYHPIHINQLWHMLLTSQPIILHYILMITIMFALPVYVCRAIHRTLSYKFCSGSRPRILPIFFLARALSHFTNNHPRIHSIVSLAERRLSGSKHKHIIEAPRNKLHLLACLIWLACCKSRMQLLTIPLR